MTVNSASLFSPIEARKPKLAVVVIGVGRRGVVATRRLLTTFCPSQSACKVSRVICSIRPTDLIWLQPHEQRQRRVPSFVAGSVCIPPSRTRGESQPLHARHVGRDP